MKALLLLLGMVLGKVELLPAQDLPGGRPSARLRVLHSPPGEGAQNVVGSLVDADSAVLRLRRGQEIRTLPWARVQRVQVSVKRRSSHAETTGAVLGGIVGIAIFKQWADANYPRSEYSGAGAATIGLPAGAVAGYVAGKILGAERWRTVSAREIASSASSQPPPQRVATCVTGESSDTLARALTVATPSTGDIQAEEYPKAAPALAQPVIGFPGGAYGFSEEWVTLFRHRFGLHGPARRIALDAVVRVGEHDSVSVFVERRSISPRVPDVVYVLNAECRFVPYSIPENMRG